MKDLGGEHNMIITEELMPSSAFRSSVCSTCAFFGGHWTVFPDTKHLYKKKQVNVDFLVTLLGLSHFNLLSGLLPVPSSIFEATFCLLYI